jgi:hypothetical protein
MGTIGETLAVLIFGAVLGGVIIGITIRTVADNQWRTIHREAMVKHGCGYYDQATGEFREKDAGGK